MSAPATLPPWRAVVTGAAGAPASPFAFYAPDPDEEAWHASPAGLRASAATLRRHAADATQRAEALEREAMEKERGK